MDERRGLVVFDLDGTLLRGQTVCEVLAAPLGRSDEMKQFESLSIESDIVKARARMAEWYSGYAIATLQLHLQNAQWAQNAHVAIERLQAHGLEVAIASITWKFAVGWFAEQLQIRHYLGTGLAASGEIIHIWGRDKATWMKELAAQFNIPATRLAAVGDSNGDAEMLESAALRFFVGKVPPAHIPNLCHLPNADIAMIADEILDAWA